MSHSSSTVAQEFIELFVTYEGGRRSTHLLTEGKVLMVGSAPHHGLSLQSNGIAHTHCMITLREGQVHVRDWNSQTGTFLNGKRLEDEGRIGPGDSIRIGNCVIEIADSRAKVRSHTESIPGEWAIADEASLDDEDLGSKLLKMIEGGRRSDPVAADLEPVEQTLHEVSDVLELLSQEDSASLTSLDDWFAAIPADADETSVPADGDDLQLLKKELDDRELRIRELEALLTAESSQRLLPAEAEQAKLVESMSERLQQVLEELERSDERVSLLTDLLSKADEASRAAQEERTQIETWISEIEQLFSARESEWHAQRETLQKRIEGITAQRDDLERKLVSGGASRVAAATGQNADQLQQQQLEIQRLKRSLETLKEERNQLEAEVKAGQGQNLQQKIQAQVEARLREERLQLAEERSELTRLQQELATVEQKTTAVSQKSAEDPRAVDYRIRAFREHLREIHETDPKPANNRDGMSHRLGRLWRKLNGTPLDTD